MAIRVETNHGLQEGGGQLEGERDEADLREAEPEGRFQDWVDRRNQRLDHVVEQVRKAERQQDGEPCSLFDTARLFP